MQGCIQEGSPIYFSNLYATMEIYVLIASYQLRVCEICLQIDENNDTQYNNEPIFSNFPVEMC